MEAVVGMRDAHVFSLSAVDLVPEDPPSAIFAMRIHSLLTIRAFAAGGDAGNENVIAHLEARDAAPDFVDYSDAFMS